MFTPLILTMGSAQNGCTRFATCSPTATALAVLGSDALSCSAAFTITGPCTAQCPPPEGTNRVMTLEQIYDQNGSVCAEENDTNNCANQSARPVSRIRPRMPPYSGYARSSGAAAR